MYKYRLIRSKRKTIALEVSENGELIVRAPVMCSQKKIDVFIKRNEEWIDKAQKRQETRKNNKLELTDDQIKKLKKLARKVLPEKVKKYSEIMGVRPTGVKITSAQKRFGSCSGKNSINFSYILMLYPEEAIDYVVVHELAHTVHHNHSKDFYSLCERYMPDYKAREKLLKGMQTLPDSCN